MAALSMERPTYEIEDVPARLGGGHIVRRTHGGVTVAHRVRPGDAAYAAVAALSAAFVVIGEKEEAALLDEVEQTLGFRAAPPADAVAKPAGEPAAAARAADRPARRPVRRRTPQQQLAWRVEALGYSRAARLALAAHVLGRAVESYAPLTVAECVRVWEAAVRRTSA
ncbi:MAG TPA: hypothetical protein VK610_04230 [Rhodothermales bacterium]|nr:hypothetical protein [Rhodothermales bacterium]